MNMTVESQDAYFRFIDRQGAQLVGKNDYILEPLKLSNARSKKDGKLFRDNQLIYQSLDQSVF